MTLPLDGACYADHASVQLGTVVENVSLAVNTYRLRFYAPEIARRILPGQFVMVRLEKGNDPLLARPLALYDTVVDGSGHPIGIDIVYLVVGKLTGRWPVWRPATSSWCGVPWATALPRDRSSIC